MNARPRIPHHDKYISAHEAGEHAFCPESYRLSLLGTKTSKTNMRKMEQGTKAHESWAADGRKHPLILLIIAAAFLGYALYMLYMGQQ